MSNLWDKYIGCGRPWAVYHNARLLLALHRKGEVWEKTFTVNKDLCYVYVTVGHRCVFKQRIFTLDKPEVFEYGDWVKDLNDAVDSALGWKKRLAKK